MKNDKNKIQGKKNWRALPPFYGKFATLTAEKFHPQVQQMVFLHKTGLKMDQNVLKRAQKGLKINLGGLKIVFLYYPPFPHHLWTKSAK